MKKGVRYTPAIGQAFCDLLANSEQSVQQILDSNPGFPCWDALWKWRKRHPKFAAAWQAAREQQAERFIQRCIEFTREVDGKNAHAVRVKFDIYKWIASKILPATYGDKPSTISQTNTTALVVSNDKLDAIRAKLDASRSRLRDRNEKLLDKDGAADNANNDSSDPHGVKQDVKTTDFDAERLISNAKNANDLLPQFHQGPEQNKESYTCQR